MHKEIGKIQPHQIMLTLNLKASDLNNFLIMDFVEIQSNGDYRLDELASNWASFWVPIQESGVVEVEHILSVEGLNW